MQYFNESMSLDEGKKEYKRLLKEFHPDVGGSEEICKKIISEFESFCNAKIQGAFNGAKNTFDADANVFASILKKVMEFNCKIEIIGFWIYATESYEYKDQLRNMGFFWAAGKKAWIYNGESKKKIRSKYSLDDVRKMKGSRMLRDREENLKLA